MRGADALVRKRYVMIVVLLTPLHDGGGNYD